MKFKIEFDFGVGVTADGRLLAPGTVEVALRTIAGDLAFTTGGCSLLKRDGVWLDGDDLVREPGCTLVTISDNLDCIPRTVRLIKEWLEQKAVLVTTYHVSSECL